MSTWKSIHPKLRELYKEIVIEHSNTVSSNTALNSGAKAYNLMMELTDELNGKNDEPHGDTRLCPDCGWIVNYNSYFGAYMCEKCPWMDDSPRRERLERYRK